MHNLDSAQLAAVPFPKPEEHFGSYIRRLAIDNGMPSLYSLARQLGLNHLTPNSDEIAWQRLAAATGLEIKRLDALRMHSSGSGRNRLKLIEGANIPWAFLDRIHLRICPDCLAEDGYVSIRFAIRQVTACVKHQLRLVDECLCGRARRCFEPKSIWGCPHCGIHITEITRIPADPRELLIATLISPRSKLKNCDLPAGIRAAPISARAAVVERLGRLHRLEENDQPSRSHHNIAAKLPDGIDKKRRLEEDRQMVMAAADLLSDWPTSYHALLARLLDRHPDPKGAKALLRRFGSVAGRLAVRSFVDHDRRIIPFADKARMHFLQKNLGYVRSENLMTTASEQFARMPCAPIGETSALRIPANFVSGIEIGKRLHVGDSWHIESWFEAGLLPTVRHSDGSVLVRRKDFDSAMRRVARLPQGDGASEDYAASTALNNRRGSHYRQRYFYEDIFSGHIRSRSSNGDAEGMASRLLHRGDFEYQRMLCKTAMQIINDAYVGVLFFIPALWSLPSPSKHIRDVWCAEGRVRWIAGKTLPRLSVRDVVRVIQEDGERPIFDTDEAKLAALSTASWRSIVF